MNWARAKNLCLVFLLLLNVFLFVMIKISDDRYKLDKASLDSINNLLEKNNISVGKIMPKFYPKRQLVLSDTPPDKDKLTKIFFKGEKFSSDNDNCISNEKKRLEFVKNGFQCEFFLPQKFDSRKKLNDECKEIVKKVKEPQENFVLDTQKYGGKIIEYRQKFHSMIILDNFVRFEIENSAIKKIECQYRQPTNFLGPKYEIVSPDVILFEYMNTDEIVKKNGTKINKFDLTYKTMRENSGYQVALPCYRFVFDDDFEMLFNAYTGKVCR